MKPNNMPGPMPGSRKSTGGDKKLRRLFKAIRREGGEVEPTGSGHYRISVGGTFVTTIAATPSEYRARLNAMATMRRAGLNISKADW